MPGDDPDAIERALEALIAREPAAVTRLQRRPGQKEVRYAHRFAGEVVYEKEDTIAAAPVLSADRIAALEELTHELRAEVGDLRAQLETFRKQFE